MRRPLGAEKIRECVRLHRVDGITYEVRHYTPDGQVHVIYRSQDMDAARQYLRYARAAIAQGQRP